MTTVLGRMGFPAVACSLVMSVGLASTDDGSWFKMAVSDGSSSWKVTSYDLQNWIDPVTATNAFAVAGNRYCVPAGYVLHTGEKDTAFPGDSLAVAGTIECRLGGSKLMPYTEVRLLPGSSYYHSSKNYMNAKRLVIEGTAAQPAEDDMYGFSAEQYTQHETSAMAVIARSR